MMEFIHNNSVLISMSMVAYIVLYLMLVIGWFFSTDYYDKYIAWYDGDDEGPPIVFVLQTVVLGLYLGVLLFTDKGYDANGALFISMFMWVVLVVPTTICGVLKARMYLRKKRGKA